MALREQFWVRYPLTEWTVDEWEALCDGCAKCCLHKLEDADSGSVYTTRVACELLDIERCRCGDYSARRVRVPGCLSLQPDQLDALGWLPFSCAYRRIADGRPLADWHHLVSGDPDAVHRVGASVRGRAIPAQYVHPDGLQEHIIQWVNDDDV